MLRVGLGAQRESRPRDDARGLHALLRCHACAQGVAGQQHRGVDCGLWNNASWYTPDPAVESGEFSPHFVLEDDSWCSRVSRDL